MEVGRAAAGFVTYQAEFLSRPIGADRRRINWRYAFAVGSYHLIALLGLLPWFFSWTGVALAVIGVYVFGAAGINLCYHRLLSHRSFSCPLWA
jgi:fatty-acid desaturase